MVCLNLSAWSGFPAWNRGYLNATWPVTQLLISQEPIWYANNDLKVIWFHCHNTANTIPVPNVGLMLGHRLPRWPNIKLALDESPVLPYSRSVWTVLECDTYKVLNNI